MEIAVEIERQDTVVALTKRCEVFQMMGLFDCFLHSNINFAAHSRSAADSGLTYNPSNFSCFF